MAGKKYRYLLKAGRHTQGATLNKKGKVIPGPVYKKGDEFESDVDLIKKFGPASLAKFEPLGETATALQEKRRAATAKV